MIQAIFPFLTICVGQAQALRHGVAKALEIFEPAWRAPLRTGLRSNIFDDFSVFIFSGLPDTRRSRGGKEKTRTKEGTQEVPMGQALNSLRIRINTLSRVKRQTKAKIQHFNVLFEKD